MMVSALTRPLARYNLLTWSEAFDNAAWTKTRATITANVIAAPDGTTTADKLVEDSTASSTHFVSQSVTVASGATATDSIFLKAAERTVAVLQETQTATSLTVNLSTGAIISGSGTVTDAGDGWYRVSITATVPATTANLNIYLHNGSSTTYTGDGSSGVYIWGAKVVEGSATGDYVKREGGAAHSLTSPIALI